MRLRVIPLLLVLLLGVAACGGGEEDAGAPQVEATIDPAEEVPPAPPAPVAEEPIIAGLDDELAEGLAYCAQGAQDWCAFVGPQLDDGQLVEVADLCGLGDDLACSAAANLAAGGFTPADVDLPAVDEGDPVAEQPDDPGPAPQDPVTEDDPAPPSTPTVELVTDGVLVDGAIVPFGATYEEVLAEVGDAFGPIRGDSGPTPIDAGCPTSGTLYRIVEHDGLVLTLLDESPYGSGYMHLASWTAFSGLPAGVTPTAYLGDAGGFPIVPGVSTVADLDAQFGTEVEFFDDEFGPTYSLEDSTGRIFGFLDGLADGDLVQSVLAGQGCGE